MNKIKVAKLDKKTKEAHIIMEVLSEFFEEGRYEYTSDTLSSMIIFPLGTFYYEEGSWVLDVDFTFCTEKNDIIFLLSLVNKIVRHKVVLEVSCGYQTVFDKNDICNGVIFQQDIHALIDEEEITEKEAEKFLTNKLIKNYRKETKCKKVT